MPEPPTETPTRPIPPPAAPPVRTPALAAAVFFASGASLVVHILTDAALPAVLAGLLVGGTVLFVRATADPAVRARVVPLLRAGVVAGLVSTVVYDLSRWVLTSVFHMRVSPFAALPLFGNALVGARPHSPASWVAGVAFHLTNGICFGIGYTVLAGRRHVAWAVAFGLGLEASMLALYPQWMQIPAFAEFTQMSVVGHVAYGLSLGLVTNALLPAPPPAGGAAP